MNRRVIVVAALLSACSGKPGRLFAGQKRLDASAHNAMFVNDKTIVSVSTVRLDIAAFDSKRLDLGVGIAKRRFIEPHIDGFSWLGDLGEKGSAVFVIRRSNGSVTGVVNTGTQLLEVVPSGGGQHVLVVRSTAGLPDEHPPEFAKRPTGTLPPSPPSPEPVIFGKTEIKVIFMYTAAVASKVEDMESMVQLALSQANYANLKSGVAAWFKLAHHFQEKVTEEHPNFTTNLDRFVDKGDDLFDDIHKYRDQHGGDLAVLLVDGEKCATSYRGYSAQIMATENMAFAIVDYRFAKSYYTVAHELGHLMGLRHDFASDSDVQPFPEGHGYRAADWRTIMATACSDESKCPRLLRWSNKKLGWGDEHADNAAVLKKTKKTVSKFR